MNILKIIKIAYLNMFRDAELCPDCGTKTNAQGYNHLVCPKCKQVYFCEHGNKASEGLDNE